MIAVTATASGHHHLQTGSGEPGRARL